MKKLLFLLLLPFCAYSYDDLGRSTVNSTTTPLSSGATFTGKWELNDYPTVLVSLKTDNSGTLFFDFSTDGENAEKQRQGWIDFLSDVDRPKQKPEEVKAKEQGIIGYLDGEPIYK